MGWFRVLVNHQDGTIEFLKNGSTQGIAFGGLAVPVCPAIMIAGNGTKASFVPKNSFVAEVHDWGERVVTTSLRLLLTLLFAIKYFVLAVVQKWHVLIGSHKILQILDCEEDDCEDLNHLQQMRLTCFSTNYFGF